MCVFVGVRECVCGDVRVGVRVLVDVREGEFVWGCVCSCE